MGSIQRFFKGSDKKKAVSWALYDFANSSYTTIILIFIFPIYFKEVIAGNAMGDFYWGLIGGISILFAGIFSPFIGALVDYDSKKRWRFVLFTLISVIAAASLYFTGSGDLWFASLVFITSNLFSSLAFSMYDSYLGHVSNKKNAGRISGLGYSLGYLGGIVTILILKPFYSGGYEGELEHLYKLTFPLTALFFLVFSIPSFFYLRDAEVGGKRRESIFSLIKRGFSGVSHTFKKFKRRKHLFWFLIAFYLLSDALVTVFAFISLYGSESLALTINEIGWIFIIVQVVAIPASIATGILADRVGQKRVLLCSLTGWIIIVLLLAIAPARNWLLAYIVAFLTGLVTGGSQSVARSWFSNLVPAKERFSLFGFNSFATKISAVIGPILFGTISSFSGNQRLAMLSLIPFFIASMIIFTRIKEK